MTFTTNCLMTLIVTTYNFWSELKLEMTKAYHSVISTLYSEDQLNFSRYSL